MRVYNLSSQPVAYLGKVISPKGSLEFPTLYQVPNRDLELQRKGVLSFGKEPPRSRRSPKTDRSEATQESTFSLVSPPEESLFTHDAPVEYESAEEESPKRPTKRRK